MSLKFAVGLIPVRFEEGEVLYAFQKRSPDNLLYPNRLGFFGGKIEGGESPKQCLVRELREEIGLKIGVRAVTDCGTFVVPGDLEPSKNLIFYTYALPVIHRTQINDGNGEGVPEFFSRTMIGTEYMRLRMPPASWAILSAMTAKTV